MEDSIPEDQLLCWAKRRIEEAREIILTDFNRSRAGKAQRVGEL